MPKRKRQWTYLMQKCNQVYLVMKTQEIKNRTLKSAVRWFGNADKFSKILYKNEVIINLLSVVDIYSEFFTDEMIKNFVSGLNIIPYIQNSNNDIEQKEYERIFLENTQPLLNVLIECLNHYKDTLIESEVSGEEIIFTGRVLIPISKKAIKTFIDKNKLFPFTPKDIEKIILDFIDYKENFHKKPEILNRNTRNENSEVKVKHNYPTLKTSFYDPVKIYNTFFKGVFAICNQDCFNDWIVEGYIGSEPIKLLATGRKSLKTGEKSIPISQFRKFIEKITGDKENTKDGYFNLIFNIKLNNIETANTLNPKYSKLLKLCEK